MLRFPFLMSIVLTALVICCGCASIPHPPTSNLLQSYEDMFTSPVVRFDNSSGENVCVVTYRHLGSPEMLYNESDTAIELRGMWGEIYHIFSLATLEQLRNHPQQYPGYIVEITAQPPPLEQKGEVPNFSLVFEAWISGDDLRNSQSAVEINDHLYIIEHRWTREVIVEPPIS